MSRIQRIGLVERGHPKISLLRQCTLLGVHRSGLYRDRSLREDEYNLKLMRLILTAESFLNNQDHNQKT